MFLGEGKAYASTGGMRPWIGEALGIRASPIGGGLLPVPAALMVGSSNQSWNGVPLPLALDALGRPDCLIYVSIDAMLSAPATYNVNWGIDIPDCSACVGSKWYMQVVGMQLGQLLTSNALELTIGQR